MRAESQDPGQAATTDTTNTFATPSPPLPPTPYGVFGWRCLRLGLHFVWGSLVTAAIYPWINEAKRLRIKQRWSRRTLELLSIHIDAPLVDMPPGCLIVANHISWFDIFAINALRPADFIAKSEVRRWPFIGWLSARNDTLFLHRGSRTHSRGNQSRDCHPASSQSRHCRFSGRHNIGRNTAARLSCCAAATGH